jgi:hypothetical protein
MAATVFSAFFRPNQTRWKGCDYPEYTGCATESAISALTSKLGDEKDVLGVINSNIVNDKIDITPLVDDDEEEDYAIEYIFIVSLL